MEQTKTSNEAQNKKQLLLEQYEVKNGLKAKTKEQKEFTFQH
jgi:hypothetical protein